MAGSKAPPDVRVAVLGDAGEARYPMFEVAEIATDGAFLGGPLLLENGEEIAVELSFPDDSTLTLRAQVVDIASGERPGVRVIWSGLGDDERALLETKLT